MGKLYVDGIAENDWCYKTYCGAHKGTHKCANHPSKWASQPDDELRTKTASVMASDHHRLVPQQRVVVAAIPRTGPHNLIETKRNLLRYQVAQGVILHLARCKNIIIKICYAFLIWPLDIKDIGRLLCATPKVIAMVMTRCCLTLVSTSFRPTFHDICHLLLFYLGS